MSRRTLPQATYEYSFTSQSQLINELEIRDGQAFKVGERMELNGQDDTQIVLVSADGTKYRIEVSNAGVLSTTAV
jgi:hypothetical protein